MDIIKQLRFIFLLLGLALVALPVLDHLGYPPEELFYILFPEKRPVAAAVTAEEAYKYFEIDDSAPPPPQHITYAPQESNIGMLDINTQEEVNAHIAPAPTPVAAKTKSKWIAPPIGFQTRSTYSFLIYREQKEVNDKIERVLEGIHGNLMLDLVPFTLIKAPAKSLVVLFSDKANYTDFTKRPSWSGAACDVPRETLYVLETSGFYPLSIHEMTHLYFDGFFAPKKMPLWISEGMATYMQIKTSGITPGWAVRAMERLKKGDMVDMDTFTTTRTLGDMPADYVELWYTQAYSIVDYLLNTRTKDEFYAFCLGMAAGQEQTTALYRAYGLPFTQFKALQSVWMYDMLGLTGPAPAADLQEPAARKNQRPGK